MQRKDDYSVLYAPFRLALAVRMVSSLSLSRMIGLFLDAPGRTLVLISDMPLTSLRRDDALDLDVTFLIPPLALCRWLWFCGCVGRLEVLFRSFLR